MLKRLSFAFVGACAVTLVLILAMSELAKFFERPDSDVYMRVMDFIPGSGARRLPDKRMPEAQPGRTSVGAGELTREPLDDAPARLQFDAGSEQIEVRVDLEPPPND